MERTFEMDFEERKQHVREAIAEVLEDNTDAFVEVCEELDNWNGFLGDARCYDMCEIDDFFDKTSDFLDKMGDFDSNDEYFYFDLGYVTTASDKYDVYSDEVSADDIIDAIEDCYNHIDITDTTLNELCEILFNEDFGIDEDFEEEDIEDYESDEEFTQRIADIM
jgi:hypothetical protein